MDMFLNITEFWLQFYFFSLQKFLQMHYKLKKENGLYIWTILLCHATESVILYFQHIVNY